MQKRKTFTREFKLEAVRLLERGDRPAAELAREGRANFAQESG